MATEERKGDWIQTHTGRRVYPLDMRPEDIELEDIAWALSHICRFTGHVSRFYSVSAHSIRVYERVESMMPGNPDDIALHALLHDAHEAYIGDMARPLKRSLFPDSHYMDYLSDEIQRAIEKRFGLSRPTLEMKTIIKTVDTKLLMTEARDLMGDVRDWHEIDKYEYISDKWNYMVSIQDVRWYFLHTARRLIGGRMVR